MGQVPDDEIARLAGVSRGLVGDFRRKHRIAAYRGYLFEKGRGPVVKRERGDGASAARGPARPSRIEEFAHLLGVEPDAVVAAMAGVSRAAVTSWRKKRGITASQPRSTPSRGSAPRPRGRPADPRKSERLEQFRDKMGTMSDSDVAAMAGVSRDLVVDYRRKHGIKAWDGFRSKPRNRAGSAPSPAPAAAPAPAPVRAARVAGERTFAYSVTASGRGATRDFVAVGADIEAACRKARTVLEGRPDGPWTIEGIRLLVEVLQ
jgi:hypothetical protein